MASGWFQNGNNRYDPAMSTAGPRLTFAQRLERGDHWFREMLADWVQRSGLAHRQVGALSSWTMGERSPLDHSILSRLLTRKLKVSIQVIAAMARLNEAIHLWHSEGQEAALQRYGPLTPWRIKAEWLNDCPWLSMPDDPMLPMDAGDFLKVVIGDLPLPYLGDRLLLPADRLRIAEKLPALLDRTIVMAGLTPMGGMQRLLAAYPATDESRRDRFRALLLGETELSGDELREELLGIAEAIRQLRGLELGRYGPSELEAELLAMAEQG